MRDILKGAIDIHFHTSPDVVNRKVSDYELCERLSKTEMAGCVVKSHTFETAARVENLKKQFPNLELFGGVALNNSMGGLNPYAVEKMAIMGGKIVWFPTFDSLEWRKCNGEINFAEEYITVFDDNGNIKPVVNKILAIALKYDLVVSTGHLCAKEGLALLKLANEMGLKRLLVGHADNPKDEYTIEEQKLAASYGAMIEHSYFTTFFDRVSIEEIARQIRGVGVENVILSTDFGQVNALECDDGLFEYATKIMEQGFTVLTGIFNEKQAYKLVDIKTIILLGGMTPLATALDSTGASQIIADTLVKIIGGSSNVYFITIIIFILTTVMTQFMSNVVTVTLLMPIVIATANTINVVPSALIMVLCIGSTMSILTPIACPPANLIYSYGGYKFSDYFKSNWLLSVIFFIACIILTPMIWPMFV